MTNSITRVESPTHRLNVAIAGASGFVGRALVTELVKTHDVIALGRHAATAEASNARTAVEARSCDLFNLRDAELALAGADVAVYLVHSMMPSAHLTQGRFDDLDLVCADNFARAAARHGIRHIVYLGGLLPASHENLSRHLESRFEVERTLRSHGAKVTTLRAGLIIGAGGSSFDMMAKLVGRLPFMLCPRWTRSLSQPIALGDVVTLLQLAIARPDLAGRAYDIGGPDVVSYADMLRMMGAAQGTRTRVITLPIRTVKLSLLWVSVITGAPQALIRPLVESLSHDMVATDGLVLQKEAGLVAQPLRDALAEAVRDDKREATRHATPGPSPHVRRAQRAEKSRRSAAERRVCSVQRLRVGPRQSASQVAAEYVAWLPRFLRPFLRVSVDDARTCRIGVWPLHGALLELTFAPERSAEDRQLFYVTGGLLAGTVSGARARLEFRTVLDGTFVLAAIHDFVPRLPWFIYKYTQALVHLLVMRAFARRLRIAEAGS